MKYLRTLPKFILFVFCAVAFSACEKPNPHPETLDPIYEDIGKQLKSTEGDLKAAEKQLQEFREALGKVKPQTGQIKFAQKRVYDTEALIQRLKQKSTYLSLQLESRQAFDRKQYLEHYKQKKPWPIPEEALEYRAQQDLEKASRTWNAKGRIEAAKPAPAKPSGGHSDEGGGSGHGGPPPGH